jgi:hypothetical protein
LRKRENEKKEKMKKKELEMIILPDKLIQWTGKMILAIIRTM